MNFLKNVFATVIGIFVFLLIFFFGIILIGAIAGSGDSETVSVSDNSVIELDMSKINNDYAGKTYYTDMEFLNGKEKHDGLFDVVNAIEYAKTDDRIKGISILNNETELGIEQIKTLRNALEDFKKSGKFIYSYANYYTQKSYYLNSVANTMYVNPVGEIDFKGLATEVMFFKNFEDRTGLKMEVIRHGKYKSAVEPFLQNEMSDANREQLTELLSSIWNAIASDISKSRNIPEDKLNEIATQLSARTPEMALSQKMIDKIAYEDVYHNDIKKALKVDKDEDYESIKIEDYTENVATVARDNDAKDQIAVIYAQGEIGNGEGDINIIGEGSMRRALKDAREDEDIKAVVLRVNSPGGNALTSELIWREVELTKKVKPVVVSMGNYAASGGYYISCNANTIFAEATTITGSIGVFGALPNFQEAATKLGITTQKVSTHDNPGDYSPFLPLTEKQRIVMTEGVESIYKTFITRVAVGRKMNTAQVDSIAQGRVWSGTDALKIGLVDKIGGMDDALKEAAKLAKITKYRIVNFPEYEKNFDDVLAKFGLAQSKEALLKEELGPENYAAFQRLKQLQQLKGIQALMPYELNIK